MSNQHNIVYTVGGDPKRAPQYPPYGLLITPQMPSTQVYLQSLSDNILPILSLTSSNNPAASGATITLTSIVTLPFPSPEFQVPTGYIYFYNGNTVLGSGILTPGTASGIAAAQLTGQIVGASGYLALQAVYSGDTNFASGNGTLTQVKTSAG